jgi:hypothetical protein
MLVRLYDCTGASKSEKRLQPLSLKRLILSEPTDYSDRSLVNLFLFGGNTFPKRAKKKNSAHCDFVANPPVVTA